MENLLTAYPWIHPCKRDPWDVKLVGVNGKIHVQISYCSYDKLWKVDINHVVNKDGDDNIYKTYISKIVEERGVKEILDKYTKTD